MHPTVYTILHFKFYEVKSTIIWMTDKRMKTQSAGLVQIIQGMDGQIFSVFCIIIPIFIIFIRFMIEFSSAYVHIVG